MMSEELATDEFTLDLRVGYAELSDNSALITETPNCGAGTSRTNCPTGETMC